VFGNFALQSSSAHAVVLKEKKQRNATHLIEHPPILKCEINLNGTYHAIEFAGSCGGPKLGTLEGLGGPSGRLSARIGEAHLTR
jgi:hypothetical protein